ncbi:MAG: hypothetical protein JOZ69_05300 [Myxococcales bacterium]|nr:hypothetical protein [Myxococcales bacterium]
MAGLLLAAAERLRALDLPCPTVAQVIAATGASRSRAYELRDALVDVLPSLVRPVGRPPVPPPVAEPDTAYALRGAMATFIKRHPGCVHGDAERFRYADAFRHFILELREQHPDVEVELFADAVMLPLGTLKTWLDAGGRGDEDDRTDAEDDNNTSAPGAARTSAQVQVVLAAWETWRGTFGDFCKHVREEHQVTFGPALLSEILDLHGKRRPQRRRGRSPDERALRGAFETFFGGAQWVGDGSPITVTIDEQPFVFNLELMVDAHSGGFVGISIRDQEDGAAVTEALHDGIATTGKAPLAVLLDNKPSNHTDEVLAALGPDITRIRATAFRPQNKAHVEGGFGLFQQSIPEIVLRGRDPHDLGKQVLALIAQTFGRLINHRPRHDRRGLSRAELYHQPVTPERIEAARDALEERRKKQERARATLLARQEPTVRALLDEAFARLGLLDPEQHARAAIARYPLDVIVDGLAIFETKHRLRTLPTGVDARYLLGIIKNLSDEREGLLLAVELLRARLEAKDHLLAPLLRARDAARIELHDVGQRVQHFVDHALAALRRVDRLFWLCAVADEINVSAAHAPAALVDVAARRIYATHRVPARDRQEAVLFIVGQVVPLR